MVSNSNSLTWENRCGIISLAVGMTLAPVTHTSPVRRSPGGLLNDGAGDSQKGEGLTEK